MAHIVIVGASTGGMPAAYEIRNTLGSGHRITVVNPSETFSFVPSNPWIAVGWRKRSDTCFPIAPYLKKRDIDFIAQAVGPLQASREPRDASAPPGETGKAASGRRSAT